MNHHGQLAVASQFHDLSDLLYLRWILQVHSRTGKVHLQAAQSSISRPIPYLVGGRWAQGINREESDESAVTAFDLVGDVLVFGAGHACHIVVLVAEVWGAK